MEDIIKSNLPILNNEISKLIDQSNQQLQYQFNQEIQRQIRGYNQSYKKIRSGQEMIHQNQEQILMVLNRLTTLNQQIGLEIGNIQQRLSQLEQRQQEFVRLINQS